MSSVLILNSSPLNSVYIYFNRWFIGQFSMLRDDVSEMYRMWNKIHQTIQTLYAMLFLITKSCTIIVNHSDVNLITIFIVIIATIIIIVMVIFINNFKFSGITMKRFKINFLSSLSSLLL